MKPLLALVPLATVVGLLCGGCGTAKVTARHSIRSDPAAAPLSVYVADFDLNAANVHSETGLLAKVPALPGPLGGLLPPPPGTPKDPQTVARELVNSMSLSLVKSLRHSGQNAQRLPADGAVPSSGWLVRGVFARVNQGDQLERSIVGFGLGQTEVLVVVDIRELSAEAPEPFYELQTRADSGRAPGAAPTLVLGPAGAAARFVMAGQDLERNVKQTAAKIAEEIVARARRSGQTATNTAVVQLARER